MFDECLDFYHFYGTNDVIIVVTNIFFLFARIEKMFSIVSWKVIIIINAMPFPLDLIEDGSGRLNTIISIHLNC